MKVSEALRNRKSVRAFTDQEVDNELIKEILTSAGHAPSGVNTQPWNVLVLTGESKEQLQKLMEAEFRAGEKGKMDYQYYPLEWQEPYKGRRKECGLQMYSALEIAREDKEKQLNQWAANYRSFDAPVMMIFYMDGVMETGSFLDYGMFLQSVMLAATEQGLATCPQAALAEYPDIVRKFAELDDDCKIICGISLGYEETSAAVNSYRTNREAIEQWVKFL
ncbi:MAG: nitroreductase [Gammaproteobacteria bacterium]|nr:nitroreductase [Gammaproteobacteria bacterium]